MRRLAGRFLFLVTVLALMASWQGEVFAQPGSPTIQLTTIHAGMAFDLDTITYDPADETLLVGGQIHNITSANDYNLFIQGQRVTITEILGDFYFDYRVDMGPHPPGYPNTVTWPMYWMDRTYYEDPHRIYVPVTIELGENATGTVVARHRVTLLDLRKYMDKAKFLPAGDMAAMTSTIQLTPTGLDQLNETHLQSLPFPSLADFNSTLTSRLPEIDTKWRTYQDGELCFDLTWNSPFVTHFTPAWLEAEGEAILLLEAFLECDGAGTEIGASVGFAIGGVLGAAIGAGVVGLTCETLCVKVPPLPGHFEVCIGRIDAQMTSLYTGDITDSALKFDAQREITSQIFLEDVDAAVNVTLGDVVIRWKGVCEGRPMAHVTQADYNAIGYDWHECNNLHLHADDMQTNTEAGDPNPQHYMLDNIYCLGDPTIQECLDVSRLNKRPLRMSIVRNTTDEVGTCADDPLHTEIRDLMYEYYDDMEWLVNDEWHQGGAYNNQALALDEMLAPFEIGMTPTDYFTVQGEISGLASDSASGLYMEMATGTTRSLAPGAFAPSSWLYIENDDLYPDTWGETPNGNDFGLSYTVSTPFLNQILHAQTSSAQLNFTVSDGQLQAGLNAPVAKPINLKGIKGAKATLNQIHAKNLFVRFRPSFAPITYMPLDMNNLFPPDLYPVYYQGAHFILELVEARPGPLPDKVWYQVAIDFVDPYVLLRLPADPVASPDFLEPAFALDMWTFTTLYSAFPACPLHVRSMPVNCEKSIEYKLKQALKPMLQKRMLELLSQVPTPHHFDVDGLTAWPVSLEETERFQSGQNVRIYGDLSH